MACTRCGVVLDDMPIDRGPEWRAYTTEERQERSRVGHPVDRAGTTDDLLTSLSVERTDANGNALSDRKLKQIGRLANRHKWGHENNSIRDGNIQIRRIAATLSMPDVVISDAQFIFRRAAEAGLLRSYGIERTAAAAVYVAASRHGVERAVEDIADAVQMSTNQLFAVYRLLCKQLDLQIEPPTGAASIPRFCDALGLPYEVERKAINLVETFRLENVGDGTFPSTLAAAAIYTVCRQISRVPSVTLAEVETVADRNKSTISQTHSELLAYLD